MNALRVYIVRLRDIKQADYDCRFLYEKGLVDRERMDKRFVYSLRIIKGEEKILVQDGERPCPFDMTPTTVEPDTVAGESPPAEPDFYNLLRQMEGSKSERIRRSAATVRGMLEDGITRFSRADWAAITRMDKKDVSDACDYLVSHKLVVNVSQHHNHSEYVFTLPGIEQVQEETESKLQSEEEYSPLLITRLQEMVTGNSTERDQRIGTFILNMLDNDIERITTRDWVDAFHVTKQVYTSDLRRAVNLGLLRKENGRGMGTRCSYVVPKGPYSNVRCLDLTRLQQEMLGKLYACFKKKEFTIREAAKGIGCNEFSLDFHLSNFVERGIMETHEHPEYPGRAQGFSFLASPNDHPQCFNLDAGHSVASSGSGYNAELVPMAAASA